MATLAPARSGRLGRDVVVVAAVHGGLLVAGAGALALPVPARGWAVLAVLLAYGVALPLAARAVGRPDWVRLWGFVAAVSVFQVLPDQVLADLVGTLRFPDLGGPRVDGVIPVAMALMWVPPLFCTLALAGRSPARAAGIALALFAGTEMLAPALGLWEPTGDTRRVAGVAVYVLPAEAVLGWAAMAARNAVERRPWPVRLAAAFAVSTLYLGALVLAHFVLDVASWRVAG